MDDFDEIVGEIPITLSRPPPPTNLHILQYPLRHPTHPIGTDRPIQSVRIRPSTGRIELELDVKPNPDSSSFRTGNREKNIGDKQILRSTPHLSAPNTNFCLGSIKDDALVISPVAGVAQLRPAFDYINDFELNAWKTRMKEKAVKAGIETTENIAAPLEMNFRKRESERAAERRRNSHATFRQREEAEPWQQLQYIEKSNVDRDTFYQKLIDQVKEESKFDPRTDFHALFLEHTRPVALGNLPKGGGGVETFSVERLKGIKVDSAVRQLFVHSRVLRVDNVCEVLQADREQVVKICPSVAMCVRGCWICKEGIRESGRPKLATARYEMARSLIISLFRYHRVVKGLEAEEILGAPMPITVKCVEEILAEVADRKSGLGWELRVADDDQFQQEFPEICLRQNEEWERRVNNSQQSLTKFHRQAERGF